MNSVNRSTVKLKSKDEKPYKLKINWINLIAMTSLHLAALYGLYLLLTRAKWQTLIFAYVLYVLSGLGITAGSHRLWSHRSYEAKLPLRIILMVMHTLAFQYSIYLWSRYHRVHHKYSETNADPHNANRGFFFSHVGWILCERHPDCIQKLKTMDCSDILSDPVIRFQRKYFLPLVAVICFIIPSYIPIVFWNENLCNSFFVCTIFRYVWTLNMTWFVFLQFILIFILQKEKIY